MEETRTSNEARAATVDAQKETLGSRVAHLIRQRGFNQTTFAKKVGIERTELNRSLNDKRHFRPQELDWVAQALGQTVEELVAGIDLPLALRKTRDELRALAQRVLEAESERDRTRDELAALETEFADQRADWKRERAALVAAATQLRAEHERELASIRSGTAVSQRENDVALQAAHDDISQARVAAARNLRAAVALQTQLRQAQATIATERSGKVATGVLTGLAGLLLGGVLGGGSDDEDGD